MDQLHKESVAMVTNIEKPITHTIFLTEAASERVKRLIDERELKDHALRVFVSGGGCSGLQYGMGLDGEPRESDHHFEINGVRLIIDPMSIEYLTGATIDYVEDLMGGGFKIENPNAVASCGCGHSFKTSGSSQPAGAASGSCCS
jgi:iron-sulfur cluster assembly protein